MLFVRAWRRHGTNFSRICTANSGYTTRGASADVAAPATRHHALNSFCFKPKINSIPDQLDGRPVCFNCTDDSIAPRGAFWRQNRPPRYGFALSYAIKVQIEWTLYHFKNVQFWIPEALVSRCVFSFHWRHLWFSSNFNVDRVTGATVNSNRLFMVLLWFRRWR